MGVCSKHGRLNGWSCPTCDQIKATEAQTRAQTKATEAAAARNEEALRHHQEQQSGSILEAAFQNQVAVQEAAWRQEQAIANAWKLEAQAKAKRAQELYNARMYENALRQLVGPKQAIEQDGGNLLAQCIAAWSLVGLGRHDEARQYYRTAVGLLTTPDYRSKLEEHVSVLEGLPPGDDELLDVFAKVAVTNSSSWRSEPSALKELIEGLIKHNRLVPAKEILENCASSDITLWLTRYVYLIDLEKRIYSSGRTCGKCGRVGLRADASFCGACSAKLPDSAINRFAGFLGSFPFSEREKLLEFFERISNRTGDLSTETLFVRAALASQYARWEGNIDEELRSRAEASVGPAQYRGFFSFVSSRMLWAGLVIYLVSFLALALLGLEPTKSEKGSMLEGWLVTAVLVVGVVRTLRLKRTEDKRVFDGAKRAVEAELSIWRGNERTRWAKVLTPPIKIADSRP